MPQLFQNRSTVLTTNELDALVKKDRLILYYENAVLDVTDYKHPGGQKLFTDNLRKDIKKLFDDQGHSSFAYTLIEKYRIGFISAGSGADQDSELFKIHQSLDKKIDLKKPILPQIGELTRAEFQALVDRPQVLDDIDGIQLHPNKWYDLFFYKASIQMNRMILIPIVLYLLYGTLVGKSLSLLLPVIFLMHFFTGFGFWTIIEYIAHRWFLHGTEDKLPEHPTPEQLIKAFQKHQCHHAFINQRYRMSTNLYKIVMICVPLWYLLSFLHEDFAVRSVSGLVIGQLLYDSMHDFIHFGGHGAVHPWLQGMRDRHMRHHYRHKNKEFGVTTGFWDFVFDTA